MRHINIIAIDGGGIKGLLPVIMLQRLLKGFPQLLEKTTIFAGTSTGCLISLGLAKYLSEKAAGVPEPSPSLAKIRSVYEEKGAAILEERDKDYLDLPLIDNARLLAEVQEQLGETTLRDLSKYVVVPTFDMAGRELREERRRWTAKIFHNLPERARVRSLNQAQNLDAEALLESEKDTPLWKLAMYSTAIPTYFPLFDAYADGSVAANNPSMTSLALVLDEQTRIGNSIGSGQEDRINILNLGTGDYLTKEREKTLNWGLMQWVLTRTRLIEVFVRGMDSVSIYQCRQILGERFHRLSPTHKRRISSRSATERDVRRITEVAKAASLVESKTNQSTLEWLQEHW